MALPPQPFIVDTHQDLAFHCLEYNRGLVDPGEVVCMITLPWLQAAGVRLICSTLFTEPRQQEFTRRYKLHCEYEMYLEWFEQYERELWLIRDQSDLARLAQADIVEVEGRRGYPIGIILLIEGCDLLDNAGEMRTWFERGVRMASLTWNGVNHFASGCFADQRGLKAAGRELLSVMDELGMVLDLSHLSELGIEEALELYRGPVCSGHTNAQAICQIERNLRDDQAQAIARRGGVIGLNLLAPLVLRGWKRGHPLPPVSQVIRHAEHFAQITGKEHVGIGADLDGGLTPENTPLGIDRITDLARLADGLDRAGWTAGEVAGFMGANWWRYFERSLPPARR
ncbi:membrane dipeptidase [bacterium]|nr:membrane dipeptidase [bacterium]